MHSSTDSCKDNIMQRSEFKHQIFHFSIIKMCEPYQLDYLTKKKRCPRDIIFSIQLESIMATRYKTKKDYLPIKRIWTSIAMFLWYVVQDYFLIIYFYCNILPQSKITNLVDCFTYSNA